MSSIFRIEEPAPRVPPRGFALWALGFRPFYLLASIFAALSIGLWALQFSGMLGSPYLQGPLWHAHEMLFGFALAVIVGFLFTAGRNWTQPAHAHRREAGRAGAALGGGPRAGADAIRLGRGAGECGVSAGRGHCAGRAFHRFRQQAQLLLRRRCCF